MSISNLKKHLPFIICFLFVLFLSTYKLTESPPIWMDEGIISQVPRNITENGVYKVQVSPGEYVSAGFITTSYPVTLPISLSFKLFGVGLLQARIVMVIFILGLFSAVYFLARKFYDRNLLTLTLIIIATFAPLYGHGKNVLGEIPGLLFLVLGLIFVQRIESDVPQKKNSILAGLFFGLCVVTKPIFIMLGPALIIMLWRERKKMGVKEWALTSVAFIVPVVVWLSVQFSGDTFSSILSLYSNPNSVDTLTSVANNSRRLFTEAQPAYFFGMLVIWFLSIAIRAFKKIRISTVEYSAAVFSLFILMAYLRTIGFYRYFFPAQFFALFYITQSLYILIPKKVVTYSILSVLILFQLYQTSFKSWVATHYSSHRTENVGAMIDSLPKDSHFYIYQAPEIVLFLPTNNYSQYFEVTEKIHIGSTTLLEIKDGTVPLVITNSEVWEKNPSIFNKYKLKQKVEPYVILSTLSDYKK